MKLLDIWSKYWFRPAPFASLAVFRILAVAFQLVWLVWRDYLGEMAKHAAIPDLFYRPLPVLRLLTLPFGWEYRPSFELLASVYWLTTAAGLLALIGLWTNGSLLAFATGSLILQAHIYSYGDFHHPEAILLIALFLLAFSPSGRVLSMDRLLARRRLDSRSRRFEIASVLAETGRFASWPLLLLQWLMVLVYLSAALGKLVGGGLDWLNGYTLQYYLLRDGLRWGSSLGVWAGQNHLLAVLLSWVTILFEATFVLPLIFPRLALLYIPTGVALHAGIYLTMRAPFPQFLVIYAAFIPWAQVVRFLSQRPWVSFSFQRSGLPQREK